MKTLLIVVAAVMMVGCSSMPTKQCTAVYHSGGTDYIVDVYGVGKIGSQTTLRAGYPFNFQYVSASNFESNTCTK